MKARATIVVERDTAGRSVVRVLRSQAPLVLRKAAGCVYVVAAAGGPLGGDELELVIEVGEGAELVVRSVAASVVQPSLPRARSSMSVRAAVGAGGALSLLPEPVVVADRAWHSMSTRVELADGAQFQLREEIVLGRHGERGGAVVAATRVDRGGRPLLRQSVEVDGCGADRRSVLGDASAVGSLLVVRAHDAAGAPLPAVGFGVGVGFAGSRDGVAVLPLAGGGTLAIAVGDDSAQLRRRLDAAEASFRTASSAVA